MSRLKFMCPKCKHEFYAEEWATVVCPKMRDHRKEGLLDRLTPSSSEIRGKRYINELRNDYEALAIEFFGVE